MFIIFVAITLVITYWAAMRTKTATDFYAAGRGITGLQNGMAIAGDYMSAASFLGIAALVYFNGFYGLIFSVGWLVGWPIILFLIAERLRNLGKFTYADVVSFRLQQGPVRTMAAIGSLIVVIWYLIGQAVGAGQLLHTLVPQISYRISIVIIGALIIIYVTFGGMKATTWVQIIKAALLLGGATLMALGVMAHEGWSFNKLFSDAVAAHPKHLEIMQSVVPIGAKANPIESISLGLTLMFGTAGLPHILMRFFTVGDAKAARKSVLYGTCFIGYFYILTFIIGFGAIVLVAGNPEYVVDVTKNVLNLKGGSSMPAVYLSHAIGGDFFLGFIAAVAFATILAVVSGLTLAGASALSHDIYANVIMKGKATEAQEVWVSKICVIGLGILAVFLGIAFEKQNVAYIVALTFSIAACANFPILVLAVFWKGLTTRGAVLGGYTGILRVDRPVDHRSDRLDQGARHGAGNLPVRLPDLRRAAGGIDRRLRCVGDRQECPRGQGARSIRRAGGPLRDRSGRRARVGALSSRLTFEEQGRRGNPGGPSFGRRAMARNAMRGANPLG